MGISTAALEALVAAGATADMIVAAVKADAAIEEKRLAEKRAKDADRQRRYRESRNVTVTTRDSRNVTSRARVQSPEENIPPSPPKGGSVPRSRGTRLPEEFKPDIAIAEKEGLSREQAEREARKFADHFRAAPGQRGVKLDWPATWRNWCCKAVEFLDVKRPTTGPPPEPVRRVMTTEEVLAEWRAENGGNGRAVSGH